MDVLSGLLDPHARGAFLLRSVMRAPWALRIQDEAPLTVVAPVVGDAWLVPDGGEAVTLAAGDLAVVRGPRHYTVADDPTTAPQVVVHPGQRCTTLSGAALPPTFDLGVRTWGNDAVGTTKMLTGTYEAGSQVGDRLVRALPQVVVLRQDSWQSPLLPLLAVEVTRAQPGQVAVLDRLLDLVLISALRAWFGAPGNAPPWFAADGDPVIGQALRLLHHNPAHAWTVGSLAAAVGVSRATLARRFTDLVGEPPMSYLTSWRLDLAADLLHRPGATVGSVARQVGYGSPFALSTAFKRVHGVSPQHHRQRAA